MEDKNSEIKIKDVYIKAVEKFISNLSESDYASEYGSAAIRGLNEYKLDLALDIQRTVEGV